MQQTLIALAVGLLLGCGSARAQHVFANANHPGNDLPQLQYVHRYDAEKETLQLDEIREVAEVGYAREVDPASGREIYRPKEDTHQIIERRTYRVVDIQAFSPQGDTLKLADVLSKLKPEHPVLVVSKGKKLPVGYQKLFRDDVVVLQLPVSSRPGGSPSAPVLPPTMILPRGAAPAFAPADTRPGFTAPPTLPFAPPPAPPGEEVPRF